MSCKIGRVVHKIMSFIAMRSFFIKYKNVIYIYYTITQKVTNVTLTMS